MRDAKKFLVEKEGFKKLSQEVLPLVNKLTGILADNGINGLASISLSKDGYFSFSTHEMEWEMTRIDSSEPARIRYEFREEVCLDSEGTK